MCRDVGGVLGEGWGKDGRVAPLVLRMCTELPRSVIDYCVAHGCSACARTRRRPLPPCRCRLGPRSDWHANKA